MILPFSGFGERCSRVFVRRWRGAYYLTTLGTPPWSKELGPWEQRGGDREEVEERVRVNRQREREGKRDKGRGNGGRMRE